MNLGETIYKLRTEKQLSQGALAEMLEVSRQSISKWENNSAVPELEKLIHLSEIFEVSLDELVKGKVKSKDVLPFLCVVLYALRLRRTWDCGVPGRYTFCLMFICPMLRV